MTTSTVRAPALSLSASLRLPIVERWLRRLAPASILEAGCGMGAMGYRLAGRYDYRGYEPDPTSYSVADKRIGARGIVINSAVPDLPDRTFDLVAAFEVLEHIEDDLAALQGWVRWLAPGGHVIVSVPAHPERFGPCDEAVGHCRRYTRDSLTSLLRSARLEVMAIESWGMPAGYALEAVRNRLAVRRRTESPVGTAGSGRLYQPPTRLGRAVEWSLRPLAALQTPFRSTD
ncbi:MAG TPA: class I SAM-dependent methyltransferase, partial [Acidimicrobiia bacterium]